MKARTFKELYRQIDRRFDKLEFMTVRKIHGLPACELSYGMNNTSKQASKLMKAFRSLGVTVGQFNHTMASIAKHAIISVEDLEE